MRCGGFEAFVDAGATSARRMRPAPGLMAVRVARQQAAGQDRHIVLSEQAAARRRCRRRAGHAPAQR